MNEAEDARRAPRSTFGMARTSLFNLSIPEKGFDSAFPEEGSIELIGHGRIPLNLHRRMPSKELAELRNAWNEDARRTGAPLVELDQLRKQLEDSEAAALHWAADSLSGGISPLNENVRLALHGLQAAIKAVISGSTADRRLFEKFLFYIMPDMVMPLRARDRLDLELLAAVDAIARPGRDPDIGKATTWLLDTLIEDWKRHTGRPVTRGTKASSAGAI